MIPLLLQDSIDRSLLECFVDHRKLDKKKPITARGVDMLIRKLSRLEADGHCPNLLLERAIINGWQDVYPDDSTKLVKESFISKHTDRSWRDDTSWADGVVVKIKGNV
jgi:hypothetical protein